MRKKLYRLCIIPGDGIGPEVISEAELLLRHLPIAFELTVAQAGLACFKETGTSLPEETLVACAKADAILFGAVTTPPDIPNYTSAIVTLRKKLNLYANIRPIFSLPVDVSRDAIDCVIVRENTEDVYAGDEKDLGDTAITKRIITKKACRDIARFAFELAQKQKRTRVTAVHKANIMRVSDGLFLGIVRAVAEKYPEIAFEDMLVDTTAMRLIKDPQHFDVIVTTNMFGDILSDEAAMLVGGLGVVASGNYGKTAALFEPVHGSSPKYVGTHRINPIATFFAVVMMLDYLGERRISLQVKRAIIQTVRDGETTPDLGGEKTTQQVTQAVKKRLETYDTH